MSKSGALISELRALRAKVRSLSQAASVTAALTRSNSLFLEAVLAAPAGSLASASKAVSSPGAVQPILGSSAAAGPTDSGGRPC